jgi:DNA-binding MarR family transcriptional regulator
MNAKENKEEERVLELLDVVGQRSDVSQRHLARHMGVALGLANSYLKRCIRKGFIKITEAPANRYLYYLTPKGFSEKSRLTAKYLSTSFEFYREAGRSCEKILRECDERGWRRIVLCGASDLAEIVMLRTLETEIAVIGVIDSADGRQKFLGRSVWRTLKAATPFDCCVLTDLQSPQQTYQQLVNEVGRERVLVPEILRL